MLVDIAELIPHGASGRAADFFHDDGNTVFIQSLGQQTFGAFIRSHQHTGIGNTVHKFYKELFDNIGVDLAKAGHND